MEPEYEVCCKCGEPTGKAGKAEDSLYINDRGPFCEWCFDGLQAHEPEDVDQRSWPKARVRNPKGTY